MKPEQKASEYCNESVDERIDNLEADVKSLRAIIDTQRNKYEIVSNRLADLENDKRKKRREEKPELTDVEYRILEICSHNYEWVAKDTDGVLFAFESKPHLKDVEYQEYEDAGVYISVYTDDTATFDGLSSDRPYRIKELVDDAF